ncbi:PTS sugar transporter subunit IIB [Anaerofustis butyriciformans]|uniref:PTS sugar transporter subunit IIB n=1 Tax=Anaerofustis butyriciformans TaxID=3108533 RepID=UPI002E355287|nr:PTS sugar transporter subunit IIB [Anaerofustis sp. HA2171]
MITILVICGSGVATSTLASEKLKSICKEENIDIETYQCKVSDAKARAKMIDPNIIVTTAELNEEFNIPVINGKSLITQNGVAEFKKELFSVIVKLLSSNSN